MASAKKGQFAWANLDAASSAFWERIATDITPALLKVNDLLLRITQWTVSVSLCHGKTGIYTIGSEHVPVPAASGPTSWLGTHNAAHFASDIHIESNISAVNVHSKATDVAGALHDVRSAVKRAFAGDLGGGHYS